MGVVPNEDIFAPDPDELAGVQSAALPASGHEMPTTKLTSDRKRASNAVNAKKSTGPKTPEGKARSSQNAETHGLYQEHLRPIRNGPFAEDPDELQRFGAEIQSALHPRDALEAQIAHQIGVELRRAFRLARVEGSLLTVAGAPPSPEYEDVKQQVEIAANLVDYLENPGCKGPGNWRLALVEFIDGRTDPWTGPPRPYTGSMRPPEALRQRITHHWDDDMQAAQDWARAQLSELETRLDAMARWDEGWAAEGIVREMTKLGVISTQSTRNLQRLLVEYRLLQRRPIDTDCDEVDGVRGN